MSEVSKLLCMEDNCSMIRMSEVSKVKKYMYVVCTHLMSEVSKVKKYMYVVCTHLMSEVSKFTMYRIIYLYLMILYTRWRCRKKYSQCSLLNKQRLVNWWGMWFGSHFTEPNM